jgi:hypothetical protein
VGLLIGCAMLPVLGLLLFVLVALFLQDPVWTGLGMAMVVVPVALIVRAAVLDHRDRRAR